MKKTKSARTRPTNGWRCRSKYAIKSVEINCADSKGIQRLKEGNEKGKKGKETVVLSRGSQHAFCASR